MSARWLALFLATLACSSTAEPRDQWLVLVDTDAPVPEMFDRLLIEVLAANGEPACSSCRRQFGWEADVSELSFGVASADHASAAFLRARLYRVSETGPDGLPQATTSIDLIGRLPAPEGVTPVHVPLRMGCFAQESRLTEGETCEPSSGELGPIDMLGTQPVEPLEPWKLAAPVACNGNVPDSMVCVPGGAFMLGASRAFQLGALLSTTPQRLVVVSPFALDAEELTVGDYHELLRSGALLPEAPGLDAEGLCTAGAGDDALPLSCVSHTLAAALCDAQGKRLPTEAEWEYAAGNLSVESLYPWGNEGHDVCNRSVVAVDKSALGGGAGNSYCRNVRPTNDRSAGPRAAGDRDDVTSLGIFNLAGNLSEWVADKLASYADVCWRPERRWLVDPQCQGAGAAFAIRGGSWQSAPIQTQVVSRSGAANGRLPSVGVRCAQSMAPPQADSP